jgi:hypothetical protein
VIYFVDSRWLLFVHEQSGHMKVHRRYFNPSHNAEQVQDGEFALQEHHSHFGQCRFNLYIKSEGVGDRVDQIILKFWTAAFVKVII